MVGFLVKNPLTNDLHLHFSICHNFVLLLYFWPLFECCIWILLSFVQCILSLLLILSINHSIPCQSMVRMSYTYKILRCFMGNWYHHSCSIKLLMMLSTTDAPCGQGVPYESVSIRADCSYIYCSWMSGCK